MEEDINIVENMLNKESSIYKRNRRGNKEIKFEVDSNYYKAIENLIKGYKELKKENVDLQKSVDEIYEDYQDAGTKMFDYKDKVEELEKRIFYLENEAREKINQEIDKILKDSIPKSKTTALVEKIKEQHDIAIKGFIERDIPSCIADGDVAQALGWVIGEIEKLLEE